MNTSLAQVSSRKLKRKRNSFHNNPDLIVKLYELIQGKRNSVRVYSGELGGEVCFINPEVGTPTEVEKDCPIYTTRELAFVLSLNKDELRRYHYLKQRFS
ncbi:MAG: hypothetical protein D6748_10070 [Calditrichaeota bacterium]|nr:MAG: hypothetical protein D6748_10070 [Calditrichota bacterium]